MTSIGSPTLTAERLNSFIDREIDSTKKFYKVLSIGLGVTAAVVAGVATVVLAKAYIATSPFISTFSKFQHGRMIKVFTTPKNPLLFALATIGTTWGPFAVAALAGVLVYSLVNKIGEWRTGKLEQLKRSNDQAMVHETIANALKRLSGENRLEMMKEMSFEQLSGVYDSLGREKFKSLLSEKQKEELNISMHKSHTDFDPLNDTVQKVVIALNLTFLDGESY